MLYVLLFVSSLLFFLSVFIIFTPNLHILDIEVLEWMSTHRTEICNQIATALSILGGMPCVLVLTLLWCLYQTWYKKYANTVLISIGIIGSILCVWLLKFIISRPRPTEMYHLVQTYGASFPSAHSMYAATLAYLVIYIHLGHSKHILISAIAVLWLFLMGISRVYLGVHYPSDVLAGWSLSFIWITLLYLIYRKYSRNEKMKTLYF